MILTILCYWPPLWPNFTQNYVEIMPKIALDYTGWFIKYYTLIMPMNNTHFSWINSVGSFILLALAWFCWKALGRKWLPFWIQYGGQTTTNETGAVTFFEHQTWCYRNLKSNLVYAEVHTGPNWAPRVFLKLVVSYFVEKLWQCPFLIPGLLWCHDGGQYNENS